MKHGDLDEWVQFSKRVHLLPVFIRRSFICFYFFPAQYYFYWPRLDGTQLVGRQPQCRLRSQTGKWRGGRRASSSSSSSWPSGGQLGAASETFEFFGNRRNESKEDYKAEAVVFVGGVCCLVCLFFNCTCDYWGFSSASNRLASVLFLR